MLQKKEGLDKGRKRSVVSRNKPIIAFKRKYRTNPKPAVSESKEIEKIEQENYLNSVCFSDESTFHVSEKIISLKVRTWGSEKPHILVELERDNSNLMFDEDCCNLLGGEDC
ncbi:hypothetical protein TNCV_1466941 [Trichonephila clavipes]|nr:hypothetical protein TNCV_1466941 [Trichonephila clavipes]